MNNKLKILIFEGPDRAGKTTLKKKLIKERNDILFIDRFTGTNTVYRSIKPDREEAPESEFERLEALLNEQFPVLLVCCVAPPEVLTERIFETQEEDHFGDQREDIYQKMKILDQGFREYFNKTKFSNKILLDTSKVDEEKSLLIIKEELKKL